jgi:hypothetical protein
MNCFLNFWGDSDALANSKREQAAYAEMARELVLRQNGAYNRAFAEQ